METAYRNQLDLDLRLLGKPSKVSRVFLFETLGVFIFETIPRNSVFLFEAFGNLLVIEK